MKSDLSSDMSRKTIEKSSTGMKIQREFTKDIVKTLESMPIEKLEQLLGIHKVSHKPTIKPSKWAKLAEEIDIDSDLDDPAFKNAWKEMRESMKEFREGFEFKHNQ